MDQSGVKHDRGWLGVKFSPVQCIIGYNSPPGLLRLGNYLLRVDLICQLGERERERDCRPKSPAFVYFTTSSPAGSWVEEGLQVGCVVFMFSR